MKPRFIVDVNVGRLAKWLRVMGYDTLYLPGIEDDELVRIAMEEDRIILTRDSRLTERRIIASGRLKAVLIQYDDLPSQLRQVIQSLKLSSNGEFSRCLRCNASLVRLSKEIVKEQVPPYVFETCEEFMQCPRCHRVYWRGTHWANMNKELAQLREDQI